MTWSQRGRRAVVVRGGWQGHVPVEATNLFIPYLEQHGYDVRIADSPAVYADAEYVATVDLILQCFTQGNIKPEELRGLETAIRSGTGFGGWHGGIADSFRDNSDYLHLVGGQFACHPGRDPREWYAGSTDHNFVPYTVNMMSTTHPITEGLQDFDLTTEQYWVLWDQYCDVLATTTQKVRAWDPWKREVTSPAIWTRQWGEGRIFVTTPGHSIDVLEHPSVRTIIERGLLWASR
jgi:type 1 glutamine amidotransferase